MVPGNLFALGVRIPNQDAEATGRGNAFTATANNPSALYYNSAGITQLEGHHVQLGFHTISVNSSYRAPNGNLSQTHWEVQPVPQLYYVYSPKESDFSYGLGVYAPFGLGLEWPETTGFRTLIIEGRLLYSTVKPVIAWQVTPSLSIAGGPTLNYAQVLLRQGIFVPGDEFKFKGRDLDFGWSAALLWKPWEKISFGVNYQSSTSMNFHGRSVASPYTPDEGTSARLPFPQFVMGGVSYRPNDKWNFEVNVDWTDWDRVTTVNFNKPSGNVPFAFNWQSSFLYEIGATRQLENGYFASVGYFFSQNSTSDANFNPVVPDTNLHVGSLGLGRKGDKWSWAVTYQLITGPSRNVTTSISPSLIGESANGKYHFLNHAVNVSLTRTF
ncbi:MAG: outer membrane protein transport protein [Verrucomicrobiota bacterium]